ncbi:hypothetical protein BGX38DRAFT_1268851 [Terfezia claveryi]|nr:hypothetical protein BGX38DRAFT_1268851 [Terfezia claveryi]
MGKAEVEKEQKKAKKAYANLLHTWSEKTLSSSNTDSDTEVEEIPSPKRKRVWNRNSNMEVLEVVHQNGNNMTAAIKMLAQAISVKAEKKDSDLKAKVAKLEESIQDINQHIEERAEETNQLLRILLERRSDLEIFIEG